MKFIELVFILSWSSIAVGQCYNNGQVRLVGGTRNGEGRLEVYRSGYWSSVCPDGWVSRNAGVTCQELCGERKYATSVPAKGRFGPILNPIRIFDTKCAGYESSLTNCPQALELYGRNCYEDAAVGLCCHSGCDGRNMFLAPRLRYSARCDFGSYTVTVQKPATGPAFSLWPYNKPDCSYKREGENATHNWITVPFVGDCGVSLDLNDVEFVKYSQKVLIKGASIGPSVSRLYQFLLPVTCGVSRNTNKTIWLDDSPSDGNTDNLPGVNGTLNLDLVIKVYKDPNFNQELSTPVQLKVGTPVYVELSVEKDKLSGGARSKILVENCFGKASSIAGNQNKNQIIKNQAAIDEATDIFQSPAYNKVQFKMEIFKISDEKELYMDCAAYVCPLSDISARCNNPAANAQHKPGASVVVDSTASPSGSPISVVSDGYQVPTLKLKRSPIYYDNDLPGLGPDDEVRIGEEDGKCYIKFSDGGIRLYHKPRQSSFAPKAENPCLKQF